jgi:MoaA/NifB/PqqE/SkfB family radical SAM enzyme
MVGVFETGQPMSLSKKDFDSKYKALFEEAFCLANDFVLHPAKLRAEVLLDEKSRNHSRLQKPIPDPFTYRMTQYRGFVRFPERLKNYIVARNESRKSQRDFLPTLVDVEPVSRCNFRCIMCAVSDWEKGKRSEDLSLDDFDAFIKEHAWHLVEMKIQGLGEPLLHGDFFEMIRLAAEQDIWVRTTVNGSLLKARDNYLRLIDSGIGEVQTSFDGANKEIFETIRRGSNFDQIVRNLTLLNDYANKKDRVYTRMWVVVQKHNRHQIFDFVELANKMGFRRMTFSMGLIDWGKDDWTDNNQNLQAESLTLEEEERLIDISLRDGIDISVWDSTGYSTDTPEKLCPAVFGRSSVSSDLRMVPCGMLGDPQVLDLGDARDFTRFWNGENYQSFRQAHLDGNIPDCCQICYTNKN